MNFSELRHRIIFLKPLKTNKNSMGENVPVWIPFKPTLNHNIDISDDKVFLTKENGGNAVLKYKSGKPYVHKMTISAFAVWANVSPMTGREYEESQKIRAETTYKVKTRFFRSITADMKFMYNQRIFEIISVLNVGELNTELQIVAIEGDV